MEKIDSGVVYVIHNSEINIVKIGKSKDIVNRLNALSMSCGCNLTLVYTTLPTKDYGKIETIAHKHFKSERRIGEWFNISAKEAIEFIEKLVIYDNVDYIAKMYLNEANVGKIANRHNVSRAYILKILKNWNMYKSKEKLTSKKKKIKNNIDKNICFDDSNVPLRYKKNAKYKRIEANLYKHNSDEVYKVKMFKDSEIIEKYFTSKDSAIEFLKSK